MSGAVKCGDCKSGCGASGDVEDATLPPPLSTRYSHSPMFQHSTSPAPSTLGQPLTTEFVKLDCPVAWHTTFEARPGRTVLEVAPEALTFLAHAAMVDVQHFFRHEHLQGWRAILDDPESSANDRFVARQLLQNACVAAGKVLPSCQDTGTAIVLGKRGELVWTGGEDEAALGRGIWQAYTQHAFRYSQCAPLDMFEEVNTNNNLPAQFDLLATPGSAYEFFFIAKGGGSANKSYLYQQTKALLNPKSLRAFIATQLKTLGTSACPPYHLALVIGGTSAEMTMKTVKLASCRYYDDLPTTGDATGRAFRDIEWEAIVLEIARTCGIGAQFGGKYFAHQARVIRLARHGASCPVGLGVSCSADRQIKAKITADGLFLERLVYDPAAYLPDVAPSEGAGDAVVAIDLNQPMAEIRKELSKHPVRTRLSLTGPLVVARDIAHAKLKDRLDRGEPLPEYFRERIVYYAGPAKTPDGMASGSFGPTTAGRMDSYAEPFMAAGGSFVSLAKGNRSLDVTKACQKHGGFYLGSIGGPAALLAQDSITSVRVLEFPELGMEAVWAIDVKNFPAFIVVDDKGNDFFAGLT